MRPLRPAYVASVESTPARTTTARALDVIATAISLRVNTDLRLSRGIDLPIERWEVNQAQELS